jgi:menaquinone-dependent protoporphyrinogen IX oxidase
VSSQILIAYALKHGTATCSASRDAARPAGQAQGVRRIAERIAGVLERAGNTTMVRLADEVTSLRGFEVVIIGSELDEGWLPEATELLESFQVELAAKPTWLFSYLVAKFVPNGGLESVPQHLVATIQPEDIALFADGFSSVRQSPYDSTTSVENWAKEIARGH